MANLISFFCLILQIITVHLMRFTNGAETSTSSKNIKFSDDHDIKNNSHNSTSGGKTKLYLGHGIYLFKQNNQSSDWTVKNDDIPKIYRLSFPVADQPTGPVADDTGSTVQQQSTSVHPWILGLVTFVCCLLIVVVVIIMVLAYRWLRRSWYMRQYRHSIDSDLDNLVVEADPSAPKVTGCDPHMQMVNRMSLIAPDLLPYYYGYTTAVHNPAGETTDNQSDNSCYPYNLYDCNDVTSNHNNQGDKLNQPQTTLVLNLDEEENDLREICSNKLYESQVMRLCRGEHSSLGHQDTTYDVSTCESLYDGSPNCDSPVDIKSRRIGAQRQTDCVELNTTAESCDTISKIFHTDVTQCVFQEKYLGNKHVAYSYDDVSRMLSAFNISESGECVALCDDKSLPEVSCNVSNLHTL